MDNESFNPDWCSPPGNTIKDILDERGIALREFSEKLNVDCIFAGNLIHGDIEIDKHMADELSFWLGGSPEFWLKREERYRKHSKSIKLRNSND